LLRKSFNSWSAQKLEAGDGTVWSEISFRQRLRLVKNLDCVVFFMRVDKNWWRCIWRNILTWWPALQFCPVLEGTKRRISARYLQCILLLSILNMFLARQVSQKDNWNHEPKVLTEQALIWRQTCYIVWENWLFLVVWNKYLAEICLVINLFVKDRRLWQYGKYIGF